MQQLFHSLATGDQHLAELPDLVSRPNHLISRTVCSLLSSGTERMLLEFGKGSWLDKAKQQPDKVKQVMEKIRTDGLGVTLDAVRSKLGTPIPLGYSNVGVVTDIGEGCQGFSIGDRIVSNGAHAEMVAVPFRLAAKIPDEVSNDAASFAVVGSIALHGIRLLKCEIGETCLVIGLGLIGLIAVQILKASGVNVIAIDLSKEKVAIAHKLGIAAFVSKEPSEIQQICLQMTQGIGVDTALITAATNTSSPVSSAAEACRKRGRIVLTGVCDLSLERDQFYKKELSFLVSCSYGPGRYDGTYEGGGFDYPLPYVRWTVERNLQSILTLIKNRSIQTEPLVTARFEFSDVFKAYQALETSSNLALILTYGQQHTEPTERVSVVKLKSVETQKQSSDGSIAVIGGGAYALRQLAPFLISNSKKVGRVKWVVSRGGGNTHHFARRVSAELLTTEVDKALSDPETKKIFIMTPHSSHAQFVVSALNAGKDVFVEKPLCLTLEELNAIKDQYIRSSSGSSLSVGFNRRYAPLAQALFRELRAVESPATIQISVNAGSLPVDHWASDRIIGGGRLLGEGCHFIDLACWWAQSSVRSISAAGRSNSGADDSFSVLLAFESGGTAAISYAASGSKRFPKEVALVSAGGKTWELNNFRSLTSYAKVRTSSKKLWKQDKGQAGCFGAFLGLEDIGTGCSVESFFESSEVTILAHEALTNRSIIHRR